MISPINVYAAHPSTPVLRSATASAGTSANADDNSAVVNISAQGAAMSAASQTTYTYTDSIYPPGVPTSLKAKLNQVFNNPKVSVQTKNEIYASMVWSPLLAKAQPGVIKGYEPDFSSPTFSAQAFINQMITAFAKGGDMAASKALQDIPA
ncbi:MAG: hypothetical protein JO218_03560 [Burkholderiales bacterium]|nr:hypothetical protein [Burkholderiales bacterium]